MSSAIPRLLQSSEANKLRLAAIVESSEDAIISKTLDGVITSWNPAAERLYGYSAEEMVGQPIARLLPPEHTDELPDILHRLRRGEKISHYETSRVRKDSSRVEVSLSISPLIRTDGNIIGAATIARDITERKHAEAQDRERESLLNDERVGRAEAEASVRMPDIFMATASHELCTPLTVIKSTSQLLLRVCERGPVESARVIQGLRTLNKYTDQLSRLVTDMLDVSRLQTGQLALRPERFDMMGMAQEIVQEQSSQQDFEHSLKLRVFGMLPPLIADPSRVRQVLSNLVENAIKYSPAGGDVDIDLREQDLGVSVRVSDHGIGLPRGTASSIFEAFGRASNAQDSQIQGLGLGLYITRQIVEQHGGRIWASSDGEGLGTQFNFWLPGVPLQAMPKRHPRVLIVDDEPAICSSLSDLFELQGYDCRLAANGREALSAVIDWAPDLIVLDLMMPDMDGWGFRREQQAGAVGRDIPVVVISAGQHHDDGIAELACDAFLAKPFDMTELADTVQQILTREPAVDPSAHSRRLRQSA